LSGSEGALQKHDFYSISVKHLHKAAKTMWTFKEDFGYTVA